VSFEERASRSLSILSVLPLSLVAVIVVAAVVVVVVVVVVVAVVVIEEESNSSKAAGTFAPTSIRAAFTADSRNPIERSSSKEAEAEAESTEVDVDGEVDEG